MSVQLGKSSRGGDAGINDARWYTALSKIGLEYGPSFRALSGITTSGGTNEATAHVKLRSTNRLMMQESRYVIHPATMDACLHIAAIASYREAKEISKAYLPVAFKSMTVWRYPESQRNFNDGVVHGCGTLRGLRSASATIQTVDEDGRLLLEADIALSSLEVGFGAGSESQGSRQPYSRLVWRPDFDRLKYAPLQKLFQATSQVCSKELDELSALCILECLDKIPSPLNVDKYPPNLQNFHKWLQKKGAAIHPDREGRYPAAERKDRIKYLRTVLDQHAPESETLLWMVDFVSNIFSSQTAIVNMPVPSELLKRINQHGYTRRATNRQLGLLVGLFAHKNPQIKILEIGIDGGETSNTIMSVLNGNSPWPQYSQYIVSDISSKRIEIAKERLRNFKNIDFRVLDLKQDLSKQDLEENTFDLILACHVSSLSSFFEPS
jgi:hypothetical protein